MSFRDIELKPEYRSRLDNVIRDFYNPVLKQAVHTNEQWDSSRLRHFFRSQRASVVLSRMAARSK